MLTVCKNVILAPNKIPFMVTMPDPKKVKTKIVIKTLGDAWSANEIRLNIILVY